MTPLFWIKNVTDSGRMHEVGNGHLKLNLIQNNHKEYPAIFYNGIEYFEQLKHQTFDILCKIDILEISDNNTTYNLNIQDIQIK